jgi:hypothetical protein
MSPYMPVGRKGGRSSSFNSEINNSSLPFSSIAMSRSSFERSQKKGLRFNFLNKIKIGKDKKSKNYDRLNIEDIVAEDENEKTVD